MNIGHLVVVVLTAYAVSIEGKLNWKSVLRLCWPAYLLAFIGIFLSEEYGLSWGSFLSLLGVIPFWLMVKRRGKKTGVE